MIKTVFTLFAIVIWLSGIGCGPQEPWTSHTIVTGVPSADAVPSNPPE